MQLHNYKTAIAVVWVLAICAIGIATGLTSVTALLILATVALVPPVVMLQVWHGPDQSLSESIQDARR